MNTDIPLFSNTCGKLFSDRVVFASAIRETQIDSGDIKNISFGKRIRISSLLFLCIPAMFFVLPLFIHEAETFLKYSILLLGVVFFIISIVKARRDYKLKVSLKNGETITWNVWEGNVREAHKFVQQVRLRLKKAR